MNALCSGPSVAVPILGPPGVGKTTLTIEALHEKRVRERFQDERYFVGCEGCRSQDALAVSIAEALALPPGPETEARVLGELSRKPNLLVLDNVETPWERDRRNTEEFLHRLAELPAIALVASLRGEEKPAGPRWNDEIHLLPLDIDAARESFLKIAGVHHKNDPYLDDLLKQVERLPLAITLLAHQAEGDPNLDILHRRWSKERTTLLKRLGGGDRQIDLDVSLELSITSRRMNKSALRLLQLLAHLPDGVSLEELSELLPEVDEKEATTLRKVGLADPRDHRVRAYSPVCEYVRQARPPRRSDLDRAVGYFLNLTCQSTGAGPREKEKQRRLSAEAGNLEAMIDIALNRPDPIPGIDAALALTEFSTAAKSVLTQALEKVNQSTDKSRKAKLLLRLGEADIGVDDSLARPCFEEALPLFREAADTQGQADCLRRLGETAFWMSSPPKTVRAYYKKALSIYSERGDTVGQGYCLKGYGEIALHEAKHKAADRYFKQALSKFEADSNTRGVADCTRLLGEMARNHGRLVEARELFEQARSKYCDCDEVIGEANCIYELGELAFEESDFESARQNFEKSSSLYQLLDSPIGLANCKRKLGEIALRRQFDLNSARPLLENALETYASARESKKGTSVFGEAHCHRKLGELAAAEKNIPEAAQRFREAIKLYESIPNPELVNEVREELARLSAAPR